MNTLLSEASGAQMNFTMFLTLFGEKLQGTDQKSVIQNAFACFDEDGKSCVNVLLQKLVEVCCGFRNRTNSRGQTERSSDDDGGAFLRRDGG